MISVKHMMMILVSAVMFSFITKGVLPSQIDSIRLVNGSGLKGRVEVLYQGVWGTVCDDNFTDNANAARVVCASLGHPNLNAVARGSAYYGQGTGPIWVDDVSCEGDELSLNACNSSDIGIHNCRHEEDVGVSCDGGLPITIFGMRLIGGYTEMEGRLEVLVDDEWCTICNASFTDDAASVVCAGLGYPRSGVAARGSDFFGSSNGSIILDGVVCNGNEGSINDCEELPTSTYTCRHINDVGVVCGGQIDVLRLVDGTSDHEGRLEVQSEGVWGTVCDDSFTAEAAHVVCSSLGYQSSGAEVRGSAFFGQGTGLIMLDGLRCTGNEPSLNHCKHKPLRTHNCDHSEDVGVVCGVERQIDDVRLVHGSSDREGRLEVQSQGDWLTVCDDLFNDDAARVVCTSMGYTVPYPVAWSRHSWQDEPIFGRGTGHILKVYCSGNETSLNHCEHIPVDRTTCGHDEDVGVGCYDERPEPISPKPKTKSPDISTAITQGPTSAPSTVQQGGFEWEHKSNTDDDDDGNGALIGGLVGGLILLSAIIAVVAVVLVRRRRLKKRQDDIHNPSDSSSKFCGSICVLDWCLTCDCT